MKLVERVREIRLEGASVRTGEQGEKNLGEFVRSWRFVLLVIGLALVVGVTQLGSHVAKRGRGAGAEGGGLVGQRQTNAVSVPVQPLAVTESNALLHEGEYKVLYAPTEDLEVADLKMIGAARERIDAALYSLTDESLCHALASASRRGVRVRLYRDATQYAEEESKLRSQVCNAELLRAGVSVKVKAEGTELMHMKAYAVDGRLLRTGSANTSYYGETRQDNDAVYLAKAAAVAGFERQFEEIWNRPDNVTAAR